MTRALVIVLAATALSVSCSDTGLNGVRKDNLPPRTYLSVESINRPDDNRLNSQVRVRWWGDDPDGYITGYEFSLQNGAWQHTTKTDSLFILPIPVGSDRADVNFRVRAIDNADVRDPNPAVITFPIINSKPALSFRITELPSDTTYQVFSFGWNATDPDGAANLAYTEIAVNDTLNGWISLPQGVDFMTVSIGSGSGTTATGDVRVGKAFVESGLRLQGIRMDADNTFYARSVDQAGAKSPAMAKTWHVKRQTSRVLVISDLSSPDALARLNAARGYLNAAGVTAVDVIFANDGVATGGFKSPMSAAFQRTIDPTMSRALARWDYIYWLSNDLDRNITYALDLTVDFFRNGGKMFINIATKNLPSSDPVFLFLPFERLGAPGVTGALGFLVQANTKVSPADVPSAPPVRIGSANITGIYPLVPTGGYIALYNAVWRVRTLLGSQAFTGNPAVAVKNSDGNMVFLGVDVNTLNPADVPAMIGFLTVNQLGFQN
jgi:hypothetical protein